MTIYQAQAFFFCLIPAMHTIGTETGNSKIKPKGVTIHRMAYSLIKKYKHTTTKTNTIISIK